MTFSNYNDGKLFITCELVGSEDQKPNECGQYELAVCQKNDEEWAVEIISDLAHYAIENVINNGETMDIKPAVPKKSNIVAFLFKDIGHFQYFGEPANIICCVGITKKELKFSFKYGALELMKKMPQDYIYTELKRKSFV